MGSMPGRRAVGVQKHFPRSDQGDAFLPAVWITEGNQTTAQDYRGK